MKNSIKLFSLLSILSSTITFADTCPVINGLNLSAPPAGWSVLLDPVVDGEKYRFSSAVHSINGAYYQDQVICKYSSCPNAFCPAFALISDKKYDLPNVKAFPWNERSILAYTFTCTPPDHDPSHCVFQ